jgi:hypothetical protein
MEIDKTPEYGALVDTITSTYQQGRQNAALAVNSYLVETYWKIGEHIVKFEQGGKLKADYGKALLTQLSRDLSLSFGKGFSVSNLSRMRQFYTNFPIFAEVSQKLSWTHWVELLKIDDPLERSFYIKQTQIENWSINQRHAQYLLAAFREQIPTLSAQ